MNPELKKSMKEGRRQNYELKEYDEIIKRADATNKTAEFVLNNLNSFKNM